jgi:hypothetical protein
MKKQSAAFVAVATIASSLAATAASAQRAGVTAPGYYYGSDYVYPPACQWATQRFWDGHGWRVRRVRVCG